MTDDLNNVSHSVSVMLNNDQTENSFFTINSQKASEILGVNRTRLSQLTSQGIFPYERRKVESRSRLFYRLNDLLNYQRKSSFGNLPAQSTDSGRKEISQTNALIPLLPPSSSSLVKMDSKIHVSSVPKTLVKNPKLQKSPRVMQKALDLKIQRSEQIKTEKLLLAVSKVEENILQLETNIKKMMSVISNFEGALHKLGVQKLNVKKSAFHRPRPKRLFKIIKR